MPRIIALPSGAPRATDYVAQDSADVGARRSTIDDQVRAVIPDPMTSSTIDVTEDFHALASGGSGWIVFLEDGATAYCLPSGSQPGTSLLDLSVSTDSGSHITAANQGLGLALDSTHSISRTFRFVVLSGPSTVADDECEWFIGHATPVDSPDLVALCAKWSGSARSYVLRVSVAGTNYDTAVTWPTVTAYVDVRVTATSAGATVEIAADGAAFGAPVASTQAPSLGTYVAVADVTKATGAGGRNMLVGRVRHQGSLDATTSLGDGEPIPSEGGPRAHAASHQDGGTDEIATVTPAAHAIPKADGSSKLDGWISIASTSLRGLIGLVATTPNAISTAGSAGASGSAADASHTHAITAATIISAMASAASALAMNAQKITGLADGTSATDAVTKRQSDQPGTRSDSTTTPSAISASDIGGFIKLSNAGSITLPTANLSGSLRSGGSLIVSVVLSGGGTLTISDGSGCTHSGTPGALSCVIWSDDGTTWLIR